MDPHHLDAYPDADPESTYQPDADQNFILFYFILCGPDPTFHPDADPDPDPIV